MKAHVAHAGDPVMSSGQRQERGGFLDIHILTYTAVNSIQSLLFKERVEAEVVH